jgi:DNA polymerase-3 subunit delta'
MPAMMRILGHEQPRSILLASLRSGRMHHAWIFHGPPGVGKCATARWIAEILLCREPGADAPCGSCPSCRLLGAGGEHPDLHVINKELAAFSQFKKLRDKKQSNLPIDLLRERMIGGHVDERHLDPIVGRKSMMGGAKVFILDEADLLDASGQNALLKTLEEPPPGTYVFLVTTQAHELLATVRSRCQRVGFTPLDDDLVRRWLKDRPEATGLSAARLEQAARFAGGSCGRALLGLRYGLDEWRAQLQPLIEQAASGAPAPELGAMMAERVEAFAKAWVDDHDGASKDAANKAGARHLLALLGEIARDRLRGGGGAAELEPWLRGVDLAAQTESLLDSNVNMSLLLDHLSIQWSAGLNLA